MTTADYALIISLVSATAAAASCFWSIWSTFLYPKARLRLSFKVGRIVHPNVTLLGNMDEVPQFISLEITNFGPTAVRVDMAWSARRGRWGRRQFGVIIPMHDPFTPTGESHPFAGGLPKHLEVGQTMSIFFPFSAACFARHPVRYVGVRDVFGRNHWAPARDVRRVRSQLNAAFLGQPLGSLG